MPCPLTAQLSGAAAQENLELGSAERAAASAEAVCSVASILCDDKLEVYWIPIYALEDCHGNIRRGAHILTEAHLKTALLTDDSATGTIEGGLLSHPNPQFQKKATRSSELCGVQRLEWQVQQ
jgi:hypothetical protein